MIAALLSGRKGSKGLPDKNIWKVFGRPLMWYPLQAALHSGHIGRIYVSTDSEEIIRISKESASGVRIIPRPPKLATDEALLEEVLQHGFKYIREDLKESPEMLVILLCNAATVSTQNIDKGIEVLRKDKQADSAATVSLLNQYAPIRAKKIVNSRLLPAVDIKQFRGAVSCDRRCTGDIYFCDASLWVIRPRCMDYAQGQPPFRWMGKNIIPIVQRGGLDVDDEEGLYLTEQWLRRNGFSETRTPYQL